MTTAFKIEPTLPVRHHDLEELSLEVYKTSAKLTGRVHPLTIATCRHTRPSYISQSCVMPGHSEQSSDTAIFSM